MPRIDDKTPNQGTGKIPVIHNVDILDASGSMAGGKYGNAIMGINNGLKEFKNVTEVKYTATIIEFTQGWGLRLHAEQMAKTSDTNGTWITTHYFMQPVDTCHEVSGIGATGGTPLNETVGTTIERILKVTEGTEDKVILRIFTDGEENSSNGKYKNPAVLKALIDLVEKNHNFTVTYMGTKQDVEHVIRDLGINRSNTLFHMNTAASVGATYSTANMATKAYSRRAARGASQDELSSDFFKRVADEDEKEETNK